MRDYIAALGDSHFDTTSRWEECLRLHDAFIARMEADPPRLIVHTGDVFERRSTPEERNAVEARLTRMAAVAPVLIVRGNHDNPGDLAIFARLDTVHPIVVEEACGVHLIAGVAVAAVAWPQEALLLAAHPEVVGREDAAQIAREALQSVLRGLGDELARHDGPRVLAMHALVDGSLTSTGQPLIGQAMRVGLADLALARADVALLGHVHLPQAYAVGEMPCIYTGSPRRTAWGEVEDKGYVRWDLDGSRRWSRVLLPATQMLLRKGEYAEVDGVWDIRWDLETSNLQDVAGAEVRGEYRVPADRRLAAKARADAIKAEWLLRGAVVAKIEDEVIPVVRARAPEIAQAKTITEQAEILWDTRAMGVVGERRARLLAKLEVVVGPNSQAATAKGALRFRKIRHRGFPVAPFEADLDALPGPLVCFVGENGVGKTTTLELLYGSIYRSMPTRGTLGYLAATRATDLEVEFDAGDRSYRVRHLIDGATREGAVLLTDARTGAPVLKSTSVAKFDAWVREHLPSAEVVEASMFAPQGSGGLLAMKESERYRVLLRAYGCEAIEVKAEACRARARAAREALAVTSAKLAAERAAGVSVADAQASLAAAQASLALEEEDLRAARASAEECALIHARYEEDMRQATALAAKRVDLASALDAAEATRADTATRIHNNRLVLAGADQIRAAVAELAALEEEGARAQVELAQAEARVEAAKLARAVAHGATIDARQRWEALCARVGRAEQRLAGKADAEKAAGRLEGLRAELAASERAEEDGRAELARLQGVALLGAEGRIGALRGTLRDIAGGAPDPRATAGEAIERDDAAVTLAKTVPVETSNAKNAIMAAASRRRKAAEDLAAADRLAATLSGFDAIEVEVAALRAERSAAEVAIVEAERAGAAAAEALRAAEAAAGDLAAAAAPRAERRAALAVVAKKAGPLSEAQTRLGELEPQLAKVEAEIVRLTAELDASKAPASDPWAHFDRGQAERAARAATQHTVDVRLAQHDVDAARAALATAEERAEGLRSLEEDVREGEEDLADWTLLSETCGRDGIQALIIDSIGPDLTARVNDLLHTCHGPRFTMRIDAAPLTADGKRQVDGCELMVIDTQEGAQVVDGWRPAGSERPGETFSGGQKTFLGAALSLALTMVVCKRAGMEAPTLVQDEPTGSLDRDNGFAYIAMLRRAAAFVNAHRVIFVTHLPGLAELADGQVDLARPSRLSPWSAFEAKKGKGAAGAEAA